MPNTAEVQSTQFLNDQIDDFILPILTTTAVPVTAAPSLTPAPKSVKQRFPAPSRNILHPSGSQRHGLVKNTIHTDENVDNILPQDDAKFAEQAKNAHYSFDSSIQDTINDHAHTRQETR